MDTGTGADYAWHILVNAVFALGETVETPGDEQVEVLAQVLAQGVNGIEEYLEG